MALSVGLHEFSYLSHTLPTRDTRMSHGFESHAPHLVERLSYTYITALLVTNRYDAEADPGFRFPS